MNSPKFPHFLVLQKNRPPRDPPFDCTDLLAEEEVRGDDAEEEGNGGDEEVSGDHVISRSGVDCGGDIDEEQEVKMEKRHIHVSEIVHIGKEANNTEDEPLESGNVRVFKNEEKE